MVFYGAGEDAANAQIANSAFEGPVVGFRASGSKDDFARGTAHQGSNFFARRLYQSSCLTPFRMGGTGIAKGVQDVDQDGLYLRIQGCCGGVVKINHAKNLSQ
jgi:hypothetical protein